MAETVSELLIKVRSTGEDEVAENLDKSREAFDDTAESAKSSAGTLDRFSKRWMGAGLVFAGTLGTLTAAIASRMPIIDEISAGLDLVLTSLANKIDNSVRPSLSDLNDDFADLAQEIDDTEGAAEGVGTALAGAIEILEGRETPTAEMTVDFLFEVGAVTLRELDLDFSADDFEFRTPALIEVPAVVAFKIAEIGLEELGIDVLELRRRWFEFWNNMRAGAEKGIVFIKTALGTGWDLIINEAKKKLNELGQRFERRINQIIDALNRIPGVNIGNVSIGRFRTESRGAIIRRHGRASQRELSDIERRRQSRSRQIDRLITEMQNQTHETSVNIDGREVANVTNQYVGDSAINAGATGVRR